MTFKTHYEPVPVTEKPDKDGWYFVFNPHNPSDSNFCQFKDGVWQHKNAAFTYYIRPRPDTVLLTREEVETLRDELPWVSADVPPMTNGYYICWCCNPQEQGLIHYHVDTGWQNGFYNERVTHYIPISKPTSITNSNKEV